MKALILDDEHEIGLMLAKILHNNGYTSDYANSLSIARNYLRSDRYDVYFVDLNLPDGDGFEFIREIKERNNNSTIVVISAYDGISETSTVNELGVGFIKKPFHKQQVLEVLEQI